MDMRPGNPVNHLDIDTITPVRRNPALPFLLHHLKQRNMVMTFQIIIDQVR